MKINSSKSERPRNTGSGSLPSACFQRTVNPSLRVKNQVMRLFSSPVFNALLYQAQQLPRENRDSRWGSQRASAFKEATRSLEPKSKELWGESRVSKTPSCKQTTRIRGLGVMDPPPASGRPKARALPELGSSPSPRDWRRSFARPNPNPTLLTCFCTSASLRAMAKAMLGGWAPRV